METKAKFRVQPDPEFEPIERAMRSRKPVHREIYGTPRKKPLKRSRADLAVILLCNDLIVFLVTVTVVMVLGLI